MYQSKASFNLNFIIFRVGAVLPWLVSYYYDIPNLSSSTFGGLAVSSKIMTYIMALQVSKTVEFGYNELKYIFALFAVISR